MSIWTHAICTNCWEKKNPGREAHRLTKPIVERCCFCGEPTSSGIYVPHDPKESLYCDHDGLREDWSK